MAVAEVQAVEHEDAQSGVSMLDAMGTLLVEDLSEREADRLAAAGFVVAPNEAFFHVPPSPGASQAVAEEWHLKRIGADGMHERGYTGRGMRIGILDTGIDPDHPEFAGKSTVFAQFDGMGRIVSTTPHDTGSHGTHVSGIAAGNSVGVARDADLAVAAVLTEPGPNGNGAVSFFQIVAGLNWLVSGTPDELAVVNASLGGPGFNDYLRNPIARARFFGIPFVGAIGNYGRHGANYHGSPGNYDIAIGVGAIDSANEVADFSDWGTVSAYGGLIKPDLCAPGVSVRSALPGGGYGPESGTSMAAPCVAGAIALLLQENPDVAGNVPAIENLLYMKLAQPGAATAHRAGRGTLAL